MPIATHDSSDTSRRWFSLSKIGLLLLGMLAVDLLFMATTLMHDWHWIEDIRWSAEHDRGFGELFMYAQELALIVLCVLLWKRTRQMFALVWASIFMFLFADDAFQMHENLGWMFAQWSQIETQGTMRGQDYGEMVAWAPFLVVFSVMVLSSHWYSDRRHRLFLWGLYVLAAGLVGFGVGLDILSRVYNFWGHTNIVSMLEDGGEMVVVSLMLAYLLYSVSSTGTGRDAVLPPKAADEHPSRAA